MALTACPECDAQISNKASRCPKCGYELKKTKKKTSFFVKLILFLCLVPLGVFSILVVVAAVEKHKIKSDATDASWNTSARQEKNPESEAEIKQPDPISNITWQEIDKIYSKRSKVTDLQKNEIWKRYKGKRVKWTGKVDDIGTTIFDSIYLNVKMNTISFGSDLHIDLRPEQKEKALKMSKGDEVCIVGTLKNWGTLMPVDLTDGEIVPASTTEGVTSKSKIETSPTTPVDDEDKKQNAEANAMRTNLLRSAGIKDNVRKPEEKVTESDSPRKTTATDPLEAARFRGHEIGVKMLANQNAAKQLMSDVVNASRQNDTSQAQNLQRQLGMLQRTKSQIETEGVECAKTLNQAERDAFVEGAQAAQAGK